MVAQTARELYLNHIAGFFPDVRAGPCAHGERCFLSNSRQLGRLSCGLSIGDHGRAGGAMDLAKTGGLNGQCTEQSRIFYRYELAGPGFVQSQFVNAIP